MPIKGLTDKRRISRGGHLRIGEKAISPKSGAEYPKAVDHFIPDFEDPDMVPLFTQLYGENPKRVTVAFPSDDPEQFFQQWYKAYGKSSGLKCKGDGETAMRYETEDEGGGGLVEVKCLCPDECEFAQQHGCKRLGSLQFFVRGLPGIQVIQINTTSYNSIVNLNTGIDMMQRLRGARGIAGVWVDLLIKPQEAQVQGKKKNIFVLDLYIPVNLDNILGLTSAFEPVACLPAPSDARDPMLHPIGGFEPEPEGSDLDRAFGPVDALTTVDAEFSETGTPGDFANDPDVWAAFELAGAPELKRTAILASAKDGDWTKAEIIGAIQKSTTGPAARQPIKPPKAKAGGNDTNRFTGTVDSATFVKDGKDASGKQWKLYGIVIDGERYAAFGESIFSTAETAHSSGAPVVVEWKQGVKGKSLVSLAMAGEASE